MKTYLKITTALILILALCLALTACSGSSGGSSGNTAEKTKYVAVGDSFPYAGGTLTVENIKEGVDGVAGSDDLGEPEGKWVSISFGVEDLESHTMIKEEFVLNGKACVSYSPELAITGSSYVMTGLTAVFDVDKNANIKQLELRITMLDVTEGEEDETAAQD